MTPLDERGRARGCRRMRMCVAPQDLLQGRVGSHGGVEHDQEGHRPTREGKDEPELEEALDFLLVSDEHVNYPCARRHAPCRNTPGKVPHPPVPRAPHS